METQVLFVAPFKDLADLAQEVVKERFGKEQGLIQIVKGDLQESIASVRQAVEDGVEVIVSRGGTANLIEKKVNIPLVRIQVTVTDVLRALVRRGEYPKQIGIAGFESVIYGCDELGKLLGIRFYEIALKDESEALTKISEALDHGVDLVVGDAISTKIAARLGAHGELIHSGKESVYKALHEALMIAKIRREEQRKSEILQAIINHSEEGIIATDRDGCVNMFNPVAEKLFGCSQNAAMGQALTEFLPGFNAENLSEDGDDLQKIGDKTIAIQGVKVEVKAQNVGRIYTLQNITTVQRLEQNIRRKLSAKGLVAKHHMDDIIGESDACIAMKRKAEKYALTQSTILITGESGTGKELLVQSIHNMSMRANGPFVAINCAALPENLLESELFGYADGAFTGARKGGRQGLFELAHGGTLFMDEVGEMPIALQSRILRVLQERVVMHLGGDSVIPVDVRILAATNQNLAHMVDEGKFRQDLYYRLNILRLHMPTLVQRAEDIPLLASQMMKNMQNINPKIGSISSEARDYLKNCNWPGNIRQLANTMERVMLLSAGPVITRQDVIEAYDEDDVPGSLQSSGAATDRLAVIEEQTLQRVLEEENFNYSRAAKRLGIHRTTLWRKLNK